MPVEYAAVRCSLCGNLLEDRTSGVAEPRRHRSSTLGRRLSSNALPEWIYHHNLYSKQPIESFPVGPLLQTGMIL